MLLPVGMNYFLENVTAEGQKQTSKGLFKNLILILNPKLANSEKGVNFIKSSFVMYVLLNSWKYLSLIKDLMIKYEPV